MPAFGRLPLAYEYVRQGKHTTIIFKFQISIIDLVALVRYKIILPVLRYPIPYNFYPVLRVAKYLGFDRKPEELKSPPVEGYNRTLGFNFVSTFHFILF